jgi:hypothetical protein
MILLGYPVPPPRSLRSGARTRLTVEDLSFLFPQFVTAGSPLVPQLLILAAILLAITIACLGAVLVTERGTAAGIATFLRRPTIPTRCATTSASVCSRPQHARDAGYRLYGR